MKRQERRGAYADGDLSDSSSAEEKCPEAEQPPVTRCQAWRSLARTAQDDQLLLEQKMLRDHRAHATGATQCRGHDGQVKQGEQEVLHARDSVGQTSGATQRGLNLGFSERIGNSRRTGGAPRRAPAEGGDVVAVEDQLAIGITARQRRDQPLIGRLLGVNRSFTGCEAHGRHGAPTGTRKEIRRCLILL